MRRSRNRLTVVGSGNFVELWRHRPGSGKRRGTIWRQRLLFRFTFSSNGRLKCQPGGMLSRNMFDRLSSGALRLRSGSAFESEDDLADSDLVAFFNPNFFDD